MKSLRSNILYKFKLQTCARFSTSSNLRQEKQSTLDVQEIINHSKHGDYWWDLNGQFKALHSMNPCRIKLVRDGLANAGYKEVEPSQPLKGLKLLDVGCGGGILSEPLARMGAQVTGIDAATELLSIANEHASLDKDLSTNLTYVNTTIEDFADENKEKYDAVIASEILEHVINQELFLQKCTEVLKPKGSIFVTTLNKNLISWLGGIVAAEYILKLLPIGIHDWNKFITPEETRRLLEKCNCKTKLIHGLCYNPLTNTWSFTTSTVINYGIHAVKQEAPTKS